MSHATFPPVRILHLADVHLDRPFVGLPLDAARQRRGELRATFERCLQLARDRGIDLVTIGGDLWEEEHVTADTRAWAAAKLEALELPVAIVCGNHDALIPGGSHARTVWPANVHRFVSCEPTELRIDQVSVWGASWTGGDFSVEFLERFRAPRDGRTHLLLVHGTAGASAYLDEEGRYGPFDAEAVTRADFARRVGYDQYKRETRSRPACAPCRPACGTITRLWEQTDGLAAVFGGRACVDARSLQSGVAEQLGGNHQVGAAAHERGCE